MSTKEIRPSEWGSFFDSYTREHTGWIVKFEILNEEIGNQVVAENLPLSGINADVEDGNNKINVMVGDKPAGHVSHSITNLSKSILVSTVSGKETLEFETNDGTKTILSLSKPATEIKVKRMRTSDRSFRRNSLL